MTNDNINMKKPVSFHISSDISHQMPHSFVSLNTFDVDIFR